jgi:hypothetical protein
VGKCLIHLSFLHAYYMRRLKIKQRYSNHEVSLCMGVGLKAHQLEYPLTMNEFNLKISIIYSCMYVCMYVCERWQRVNRQGSLENCAAQRKVSCDVHGPAIQVWNKYQLRSQRLVTIT